MEGCSWSVETVFLCDEASLEMLVAILFSDAVSVNIQNNERKVSIKRIMEGGLALKTD